MKSISHLKQALAAYRPWDRAEAAMHRSLLDFVDNHGDCLWRTQLLGHVTASAWVVDSDTASVLLIHHRKLDRWLQPGGHVDGDADTLAAAQREVAEETGLQTLPWVPEIFDVDVHLIPARHSEPAHYHYDVRHLLRPVAGGKIAHNHEVKAAEWVQLSAVQERTSDRSVLRLVQKTIPLIDQWFATTQM